MHSCQRKVLWKHLPESVRKALIIDLKKRFMVKIIVKKWIVFIYVSNGTYETEIKKQFELHTIASKRTKYLGTDSSCKEVSYITNTTEGKTETICDWNVWID